MASNDSSSTHEVHFPIARKDGYDERERLVVCGHLREFAVSSWSFAGSLVLQLALADAPLSPLAEYAQ